MDLWTTQERCPQAPQAQQQHKKRTFDVLQNADIFTRYQQMARASDGSEAAEEIRDGFAHHTLHPMDEPRNFKLRQQLSIKTG